MYLQGLVAELCSIYSARDDDGEPRDCIMKVGEEMTMMNSAFVFRNKQTRSEKRVNQELATEPLSIIPRASGDRERIWRPPTLRGWRLRVMR